MNNDLNEQYKEIERQNYYTNLRDIEEQEDALNEILRDFVFENLYEDGVYKEDRVKNLRQILNLYYQNERNYPKFKYKKKFTPEESMRLAKEFLQELGPQYIECLEKCQSEDTFLFSTKEISLALGLEDYSTCYYYEGKNYINVVVYFRVFDALSIIHETVHATNNYREPILHNRPINKDDQKYYTWDLFTETMSCLATHLARLYFIKSHPENKELHKEYYAEMAGHHAEYEQCDFMLNILDTYLANGHVNATDVANLLADKENDYIINASNVINDFIDKHFYNIIPEISYLLANVIARYIVNNYDYKEAIKMFNDMNEMITYDKVVNIFKYLGLDAEELDKWFIKIDDKELAKLGGKSLKKHK